MEYTAETIGDIIDVLIDVEAELNPVDENGYVWIEGFGYPITEEVE